MDGFNKQIYENEEYCKILIKDDNVMDSDSFEKSLRDLGWEKPENIDIDNLTDNDIAKLRFTFVSEEDEKAISEKIKTIKHPPTSY